MNVIGLCGRMRSGKNTIGSMLVEHDPRGATLAFADKLKEVVIDLYGATRDDVYTDEGKRRKSPFPLLKCPACQSIQCERVADTQVLAEGGRFVDENVWVRHALKRAAAALEAKTSPRRFVAITDCRFKSEKAAIEKHGGVVWRIRRPETDHQSTGLAGHASETEMETIPDTEFDAVIRNDASLEVLRARAAEQLERYLRRGESR